MSRQEIIDKYFGKAISKTQKYMSIKNIYKGWKSTLIGLILSGSGLAYVGLSLIKGVAPDYVIMSILLAVGILLVFSPDFLINKLQDFIGKKSKEV